MPTVHPQVQKARDLMPLIAAASDENDEIRELTKPVVKALIDGGFFTMLKTKSVGGMELKPSIFAQSDRGARQCGWIDRVGGVSKQRLLDHERVSRSEHCPGDFRAGRTGSSPGDRPVRHTRPHQWKAGTASPANGAS